MDTASTIVIVDPIQQAPSISSTDTVLCEGATFALSTSTAATTYNWTGPNGFTSSNQNPPVITASVLTSGVYTLIVTINGCGSADTTINITVNPLPSTPTLVVTNNVCQGDSVILTSTATATNYLWLAPNGDTVTTVTPRLAIGNGTNYITGNWNLVIINSNGCYSAVSNTESVTINPLPNAIASNNGPICLSGTVILTGNTQLGATYEWYDSGFTTLLATSNAHTISGLTAGSYTYQYILNVNGCVDTANTVVTVDQIPQAPSISSTDTVLCEGETFTLSTSTIATTYNWTGPNGFTSSNQNPVVITASSATAGVYTLNISNNGCISSDTTINITVNPLPSTPTLVVTNNVCQGDSVILTSTATATSYLWLAPNGDTVTTVLPRLAIGSGTNYITGNWNLVIINSNGCYSAASNTELVTINPLPNAIASNNGPICLSGTVILTGNTQLGATYEWYDSGFTTLLATSNTHTISGLTAGSYTYQYIINVNGCVDTANTVVIVDPIQQAPSISSTDTVLCEGATFALSTSTIATTYNWTGPNGFTSSSQNPLVITASTATAGVYTLNISNNGCGSADTTINITVNPLPSTPTLVVTNNVCQGDSVILTSTATATNYLWLAPNGDTVTTVTPRLAMVSGTYYVTGSWSLVIINSNGCYSVASNTEAVTISPNPVAIASNNGPICLSGTVTLTGNTQLGATYEWYDSGFTTLLATSNTHTISGLTAGSYTYQYILNVNGCVDTANTVVIVDPIQQAPSISSTDTVLCEGATFALSTSTIAVTYNWTGPNGFTSSSQNPLVITASTATAGVYTLNISNNGCGSADTTINITVNPLPSTPTLVVTNNVCQGDSVILTSTATATNYLWLAPNGDTVTTVLPRLAIGSGTNYITGNWNLVIINSNGCYSAASNTELVTINPLPNAIASNNGPICLSGTVTLTGNTQLGATYEWYDSGFTTLLATSNTHTISGLTAGSYTYQYILNVNGCVDTASTVVIVDPIQQSPSISSTDTVLCEGATFALSTSTIATTYNWTGPNGFTSSSQNPLVITASTATAGVYTLNISNNGCGSADTTINITVNPLPSTPTLVVTNNVCQGDSVILTSTATATSYLWLAPNGDTVTTVLPRLAMVSGTYYVTGNWNLVIINSNGCYSAASNTESVTINPLPNAIASNNGPICLSGTVTLTGNTQLGATYEWYDSSFTTLLATSNTHTISGLTAGSYTYQYILNVNGCVDTANTVVIVDPIQQAPSISSTDTVLCEGETFALSTSTTATTYNWTGPNGFTSSNQNPVVITASTATAGVYTLNISNNGCGSADTTINITVNPLPSTPTLVVTNNVCQGDSVILTSTATATNYLWLAPNGDTVTTVLPRLAIGNGTNYVTGNWSLVIINSNGCYSAVSNTESVTINPLPNAIANNNGPICLTEVVTLTGNTQSGATYEWYDSSFTTLLATSNTHTISGLAVGSYTYQYILNVNGCVDTANTVVTVYPIPQAPSISSTDTVLCEGETFVLSTSTIAVTYNWTGPNGFSSSNQNPFAITASATTAGVYTLNIVNSNGCTSVDTTIKITVNPLPSTPTLVVTNNVCQGDSVILTSTATATNYLWLAPNGDTVTTVLPRLAIGNGTNYVTGNWSLVIINSNGCYSAVSNTESVTINPLPNAIANNNGPICLTESITLSGNTLPGATYEWYDSGFTTLLATSNTHTISGLTVGSYTYQYIVNVNGCVDTANTVATVDPIPQAPSISSTDTVLCEGETFALSTSTTATTYNWTGPNGFTSSNQNPVVITASSATAGVYTLNIVNSNGCTSVDTTINITVNSLPSQPTIFGPTSICFGDTLMLSTSSSCDSSKWIGPAGASAITLSNTFLTTSTNYTGIPSTDSAYQSGAWSVICVSSDGCESSPSNAINVTINPIPVALANNNGSICLTEVVTLTGNTQSGATYEWYDSSFTTLLATSNTHTISGLAVGSYTYQYILNVNGCVDTANTVVTVYPIPQAPSISSTDTVLCEGETFALSTSTTATTYNWTGPNGFTSSSQNPLVITASTATAGVYTLNIVNSNGCTSADTTINITVNPLPSTPTLVVTNNVCQGDSVILTSTATATSYLWLAPNGDTVTTVLPRLAMVSGTYYVTGNWNLVIINSNGCYSAVSNTESVTINPLPNAIANNNGPICLSGTVTLLGNTLPGATYEWYDSSFTTLLATSNTHTISGLTAGSYTYQYIINVNGCEDTASTVVIVDPIQQAPSISSTDTVLCEGATFALSTSTAAATYNWTGPNGFSSSSQNPVVITASTATAGVYTLNVSNNGCGSADTTINITVNPLPSTPTLVVTNNVCQGDSVILTSTATATNYLWLAPNGDTVTTVLPRLAIGNGTNYVTGNWSLVIINSNGCYSAVSNTESVTINPLPNAIANNNGSICLTEVVTLTGNTQSGATYEWYDSSFTTLLATSNTHTISGLAVGSYTYQYIVNVNGCVDTASTVVTVYPIPQAPSISSTDTVLCEGETFALSTSTIAVTYNWTGPNGFSSSSQNPIVITASTATAGVLYIECC